MVRRTKIDQQEQLPTTSVNGFNRLGKTEKFLRERRDIAVETIHQVRLATALADEALRKTFDTLRARRPLVWS